ncbi:UNVERIFIED_CONTAM: Histone-lysine N-methyltransferase SETMAR [Trichonephila clavipes]
MKNGSSMIIQNAKDSGSLRMNRHEGLLSQVYIQKRLFLCISWGIRGIIHFEVLKPGETVNADLYCEQLDRLNQSLIEKYSAVINRKSVILQHDSTRPHCARKTLKKINGLGWEVSPHPTYSPDIAPTDFHLFRSMQHFLTKEKKIKIWMI